MALFGLLLSQWPFENERKKYIIEFICAFEMHTTHFIAKQSQKSWNHSDWMAVWEFSFRIFTESMFVMFYYGRMRFHAWEFIYRFMQKNRDNSSCEFSVTHLVDLLTWRQQWNRKQTSSLPSNQFSFLNIYIY